jgi:Uma2 family endonuclease
MIEAAGSATLSAMATTIAAPPVATPTEDQRITFRDVSWADFELILHIRGDRAGIRMTYLDGVLELMSPSLDHEGIKETIGRLLELYALERDIPLSAFGSWTLKSPARAIALEPDKCYTVSAGRPTRPDLAIEVVWTSGGLAKLEAYRKLEVGEVWFWRAGAIEVHVLAGESYERRGRSVLFPDLDPAELARHIDVDDQPGAIKRYRELLQRRTP